MRAQTRHELLYERGGVLGMEKSQPFECGPQCNCPPDCPMRVLDRGVRRELDIVQTHERGWGVRARRGLPRGAFVCEYVGEVVTDAEAEVRGKAADKRQLSYLYDIDGHAGGGANDNIQDDRFVVDGENCGNVARFFNHSCSPNLEARTVLVEHMEYRLGRIGMYASRDVAAGEELCYDYKYEPAKNVQRRIRCKCGSANCKMWLR